MSDCPHCDWRYDPTGEAVMARPIGSGAPVVYDGRLRVASGAEPPDGHLAAAGAHICFEHPLEPEVLILGPLEEWTPLRDLNVLLGALFSR